MAKYHIQNTKDFGIAGTVTVFYQGDNRWTTEHEHRKIYDKKADATAELYDFGGKVIKDVTYDPNAIDGDGDGIVQEGTQFERSID
jgi:hypothetical protein